MAFALGEGEAIYQDGKGIAARYADSDMVLAGEDFPCANCHGPMAQGRSEGGIEMPAITPDALMARYDIDEADLPEIFAQMVVEGRRADGSEMAPAMPRYALGMREIEALLAYLNDIEANTGLEPDKIWLEAPKDGDAANALLAGLKNCAPSGVYGRNFALGANGLLGDSDYVEILARLEAAGWALLDEHLAGEALRFQNAADEALLPSAMPDDAATSLVVNGELVALPDGVERVVGRAQDALPFANGAAHGLVFTASNGAVAYAMARNFAPSAIAYFDVGALICDGFLQAGRRANLDDIRVFIDATNWANHVSLAEWGNGDRK